MLFGIWEIVTMFVIMSLCVSFRPGNHGRPVTADGLIYIKDVNQTTARKSRKASYCGWFDLRKSCKSNHNYHVRPRLTSENYWAYVYFFYLSFTY